MDNLITEYGHLLFNLLASSLSIIFLEKFFPQSLFPSLVFWLSSFMITVTLLRIVAIRGYIRTIHSNGLLIPNEYSDARKFFRKLRNAGVMTCFVPGLLYFFTVVYPLAVSWRSEGLRCQLSQEALVLFMASSILFSLILLYQFFTEALKAMGVLRKNN
ncbi:MAG: hypothetical protein D3917_06570 [Candidatus Electrothrix sp. AX5]|nr:hypothetical protein [Candidatus Electrothrix sp. AX5]